MIPKEWLGKSVKDLDIRRRYNINIIGVKKNGKLDVTIDPDAVLTEDETLLIIGEYSAVHKWFKN